MGRCARSSARSIPETVRLRLFHRHGPSRAIGLHPARFPAQFPLRSTFPSLILRRRHRRVCLSRFFSGKARNGRFDAALIALHNQNVETFRRHFHHKIVIFKKAPNEPSQLSIEGTGHGRIERIVAAVAQIEFRLHRIKQLPERHAARLEWIASGSPSISSSALAVVLARPKHP